MKKVLLSAAGLLMILPLVPKIASAAPVSDATQEQSKEKTKVFSGTIIKDRDNFILSDSANKLSYILDDPRKASQFEGKKVRVTGTVDVAVSTCAPGCGGEPRPGATLVTPNHHEAEVGKGNRLIEQRVRTNDDLGLIEARGVRD